uniref:S8 family serine peptidase n=1 Tax=Ningiella ruwaisensis TaxID=2364274 RepID=UPI00109F1872|nr:S8 family serine peptidase [Ningiella ruwaisensis]
MKFNKYLLGVAVSSALASCYATAGDAVLGHDGNQFQEVGPAPVVNQQQSTGSYIVKMRGATAIAKAKSVGELTTDSRFTIKTGNQYNPNTPTIEQYVQTVKARQQAVAADIGVDNIAYNYAHTFNGFSARLSDAQVEALRNHPDVAAVYEDKPFQLQTSNTPKFLGLTEPGGQHTLGIKGEDVIVGILDSGISPDNPSFGEDPSVEELAYGPAPERWAGSCNTGSVGSFVNADGVVVYDDETVAPDDDFSCNNKLIGAQYFGSTFSSVYEIQFGLGEFASPRDADGHGSHTASTAAGNAGVTATLSGVDVGTVSGIAPRARVAAYKVCWNSGYVSPSGVNERGCFFGDSMAAIEKAVLDGVDVLNYSIGNVTAIDSPVYNAALKASDAGVFFAASAGNGGPGAETVSNIAPWITTVGASTYDGESALIGNALKVNSGDLAGEDLFSIPASIGTAIPEEGFTGDLALADDILACEPLTSDLTGKIALISRGVCAFTIKMSNAEAAGAVGVVVYTDDRPPIAMGAGAGDTTVINIPGVMVTQEAGLALQDSVIASTTNVTMSNEGASRTQVEVGNIMAGFSSRGQNPQTTDIIKPDITAPGVRILAATSPDQLDILGNVDGEDFAYLQGTSMSSPHIAGMAALLMGQYPDWTPSQVKSALMTTAYQGVTKEDGATPADPFDFGGGHANPVEAMNPGLVYSIDTDEYLAFLCGQGEEDVVLDTNGGERDCASLAEEYSFDPSQLNYPSIAIGTLEDPETIVRTVTDVTGLGGTYSVNVEAPEGVEVTVDTGSEDGLLVVPANGEASYSLTFTRTDDVIPELWAFGSVTLEGDNGTSVRSPIAVNPLPTIKIDVPPAVSLDLNRGRGVFPVQMFYTGPTSMDYAGLVPATPLSNFVNDESGGFDFGAGVPTSWFITTTDDTKVLRFRLSQEDVVQPEGTDGTVNIDLILYECLGFSCRFVTESRNADSNEDIILVNPSPRTSSAAGNIYLLFVHGADTLGAPTVDYTLDWFAVDNVKESTTRMSSSRRAINGRFNNVSVRTRGLEEGVTYMGSATFFDEDGEEQGTTVIEANN